MNLVYDKTLKNLCLNLNAPLYIVGGYVRNFLIDGTVSKDIDICANIPAERLERAVADLGGSVVAVYKRTGTLVFKINGIKYEYTAFRKDSYSGGGKHSPLSVEFTSDIKEDALRRDFKCNAVYYNLLSDSFSDPLGGMKDIKNGILDTVKPANEVFCSDGLRLMRLARFSGELGFKPTENVLSSAKEFADNINDISAERIWDELKKILVADTKYAFSPKTGHYIAINVLSETRVLDRILPELTLGRNMVQRSDFHKYCVLEHSLKTLLYSHKSIRFYALLHDIGKPEAMMKTGRYRSHEKVGADIVKKVLTRLKADNKTVNKAVRLTKLHMCDLDCLTKRRKVEKLILQNADIFNELMLLKQADYSGCKNDLSVCPTVAKWQAIYKDMKDSEVPFSLKELNVSATELIKIGFSGEQIGKELKKLYLTAVENPKINNREALLSLAQKHFDKLKTN